MFTVKPSPFGKTVLGAAAGVALLSCGTAFGATTTFSGTDWNTAATATNGPSGSGGWVQNSSSSTPTLSYGAYATNGGSDSASAGSSSSYGGSAE